MTCNEKWTPKGGEPLMIHDMEDSHLRNALRVVERLTTTRDSDFGRRARSLQRELDRRGEKSSDMKPEERPDIPEYEAMKREKGRAS